jgi:hypothetical protein
MANPFAQKRHLGKVKYFTFHWRDDPRKDEAWYAKQVKQTDAVALAQDIDINYMAATAGAVLPSEWVQAAVGAAEKLGYVPSGVRRGGFDIADQGPAFNALAIRHGSLLSHLLQWPGRGSDIYQSVQTVFATCDELKVDQFYYDADGVGAGVRGDARVINEARRQIGEVWISDNPFHGSGAVDDPEGEMVEEKLNKNFFLNLKAQSWWALRIRFQNTWRALHDEGPVDLDNCIFLDANAPLTGQLLMELVQPTYSRNTNGKLVVDKTPDGAASPNLADCVMIAFSPVLATLDVWGKL